MTYEFPWRRNLDNLRKDAKRWLAGLRENDVDAQARLVRVLGSPPEHRVSAQYPVSECY
jgi:hypothetical protein